MAGENFNGGDPELVAMTLRTKRLLAKLNSTDYGDAKERDRIIREIFGSAGFNVCVDIDFHCEYGKNIHVGNDVIINMNCTFVDNNRIDIGSKVMIASDVKIYTATHSCNHSCPLGWRLCRHIRPCQPWFLVGCPASLHHQYELHVC